MQETSVVGTLSNSVGRTVNAVHISECGLFSCPAGNGLFPDVTEKVGLVRNILYIGVAYRASGYTLRLPTRTDYLAPRSP